MSRPSARPRGATGEGGSATPTDGPTAKWYGLHMAVPNDTHPAIEKMMIDAYRAMTPTQKLHKVQSLNETVLLMAAARIRAEHPGIDDRELRLRVAALWVPHDLLKRATGWDPARESG